MELESECLEDIEKSAESVSKVKNNGNYDVENIDRKVLDGDEESVKKATKGKGLRKWRRFRRAEPGKETSNSIDDSNKKRGMSLLPIGMKQRSDGGGGSSSSTNAVSNVVGNGLDCVGVGLGIGIGQGFDIASRADSENSRSSTGASAPPRMNHELPTLGQGIDRNLTRNVGGMGYGVSVKSDEREKGRNVTKKARGVRIKKENSISSMESDSRSNNFVFMQGASSMTSNGRRSGWSGNYDEDDSDDGRNGDGRLNEEGGIAFSNNEGDFEDVFQEDLAGEISWEVKGDKADGHVGSSVWDTLLESIMPLHLAQEALEREVQKLRDVGKESTLSSDDSGQPSGSTFVDEELQFSKSNEVALQSKLEEALAMLKLKDTKISKLESTLNTEDIKTKHEELLTQRISAELEYLVIVNTIQNIKAEDAIARIKSTVQQKNVATPPAVEPVQLEDACKTEDARKLKNRVSKYTYCFTLQSVLLLVVLYLFVLKFSYQTVEVIPT